MFVLVILKGKMRNLKLLYICVILFGVLQFLVLFHLEKYKDFCVLFHLEKLYFYT